MRKLKVVLAAGLLLVGVACGGDDNDSDSASGSGSETAATVIEVTATDFSFELPDTIPGGTVEMNYTNSGAEPHFAAFAKIADGKTFADAKAALTAPADAPAPSGPPPFTEWAGSPTADPGGTGKLSFDLPEGSYALFCSIPSQDGVSHAAKGMVVEVTVTAGEAVDLPDSDGTITAEDFSLSAPPDLEAGETTLTLDNKGKQLHEINLVELSPGKTVDDVAAWHAAPNGPPPNKSLAGVAVAPGEQGTATFTLAKGSTYAFVCVIPDSLGDFKAHILKGMKTASFTV